MLLKKSLNQKILSILIVLSAFVLFLVSNILISHYLGVMRLDLTQNKIYTLSDGTKQIIAQIDEPITFELYFSKKIAQKNPYIRNFGKRVEELLTQYAAISHGKVILKIKEPLPFTELEDEAVSRGLRGVPVDNDGSELFFGLIASNSLKDEQVIPLIRPEREENLEYDLSRMLYSLSQNKLPTIGILSTLPIEGENDLRMMNTVNKPRAQPWIILDQIQQSFNLEMLPQELDAIPDNIDTLMLVHSKELSKTTMQAIDNFAINGGHILAFVDPYSDVTSAVNRQINVDFAEKTEKIAPLLAGWGIEVSAQVVASLADAKDVRWRLDNHEQSVRYALWMDLDKKNFAKDDIVTSNLESITLATPGAIKIIENNPARVQALISSSEDAMLVNTNDIEKYHSDPRTLLTNYQSTGKYILAARISGTITSPYTHKSVDNANIIVIADTDLLHDHFWIRFQNMNGERIAVPKASNGNFVTNVLENLSGSNALISIRNRAPLTKPFTKIKQLANVAEQEFKGKELLLVQKLEETKQKLEMYEKLEDSDITKAIENKQAREMFKKDFLNIRKELREVRHRLTQSIENLEFKVKFFSIAFMPMIITILGITLWIAQSFRYRRAF